MKHLIITTALVYLIGVVVAFTIFYIVIDPQDRKNQQFLTNISFLSWLSVLMGICLVIEEALNHFNGEENEEL